MFTTKKKNYTVVVAGGGVSAFKTNLQLKDEKSSEYLCKEVNASFTFYFNEGPKDANICLFFPKNQDELELLKKESSKKYSSSVFMRTRCESYGGNIKDDMSIVNTNLINPLFTPDAHFLPERSDDSMRYFLLHLWEVCNKITIFQEHRTKVLEAVSAYLQPTDVAKIVVDFAFFKKAEDNDLLIQESLVKSKSKSMCIIS